MPRCTETMRSRPAPSRRFHHRQQTPVDRGLRVVERGNRVARLLVRPGRRPERAAFHRVDIKVVDDQDVIERGAQARKEAGSFRDELLRRQPGTGGEQPVVGPGVVVRHGAIGKHVTHWRRRRSADDAFASIGARAALPALLLRRLLRRPLDHLQHLRRRHRQAVEALAERLVDGVGDRGHHRDQRHFADALDALRVLRVRHLDHDGVDHRQVRTHRHAVVEEAGIIDLALLVVDVLLVQRPADALATPPCSWPST